MPETRPTLDGLSPEQRVLAQAHWWLWQVWQVTPGWLAPKAVLDQLEAMMQPLTLHRLALARGRFWRQRAGDDDADTHTG